MTAQHVVIAKPLDEHFADWEASAFGFGYGTGERHTLAALKSFLVRVGGAQQPSRYDYADLERTLTPAIAWLLINILCRVRVIEYGSSPRFGWLTAEGERLKAFVDAQSIDDLVRVCCERGENYIHCYPDACNCGPTGYQKGRKCPNPFWPDRR